MNSFARLALGCLVVPIVLVGSCAGKMAFDRMMYRLPGEVLESSEQPTTKLESPVQVAEALDSYVQPRFEILRDKNFGAFRIVYRKHAGIVQLKVDTPEEKALIANVNAANRDYVISLLHCAPKPSYSGGVTTRYKVTPQLQMLYWNRQPVAPETDFPHVSSQSQKIEQETPGFDGWEKKAVAALPELMMGKEYRTKDGDWEILMRPATATKASCVSCHTDAQVGSTLGVMVYAVRMTTGNTPVKISQR